MSDYKSPVSERYSNINEIIFIIESCESQGMGGSWINPDEFLSTTNFYQNVRSIILDEKGRINEYKEKKKKRGNGDN